MTIYFQDSFSSGANGTALDMRSPEVGSWGSVSGLAIQDGNGYTANCNNISRSGVAVLSGSATFPVSISFDLKCDLLTAYSSCYTWLRMYTDGEVQWQVRFFGTKVRIETGGAPGYAQADIGSIFDGVSPVSVRVDMEIGELGRVKMTVFLNGIERLSYTHDSDSGSASVGNQYVELKTYKDAGVGSVPAYIDNFLVKTKDVIPSKPTGLTASCQEPAAPQASFSMSPETGSAPLAVDFTDTSTNSPTSWHWFFGDGGESTSQNPSHTYERNGLYQITLVTENTLGTSTYSRMIYVTGTTSTTDDPPATGVTPRFVCFRRLPTKMFILDQANCFVNQHDRDGNYQNRFGGEGIGSGQLKNPTQLTTG